MNRTTAREIAMEISFSLRTNNLTANEILDMFFDETYYETLAEENDLFSEYPDEKQMEYIRNIVLGIEEKYDSLDEFIAKYSRSWKLNRISKTARAIMRTAIYEMLYLTDIPEKVAINEAVEIAKGYEDSAVVSFINGILGSITRGEKKENEC